MTATICENGRVNESCKDSTGSEPISASNIEDTNGNIMMVDGGERQHGLKDPSASAPQTTGSTSHPLTGRAQNRGVGAIVSKAKRAAASLWMVLHAQGCRLDPSKCPHAGCQETKHLLLHVKKCPAGPEFDCPDGIQGCHQARKLLAHYRRCSAIRARQSGPGRRIVKQQHQHQCLVCSLVARHARTVLEGGNAPSQCVSVKSSPQCAGVDAKKLSGTQQPPKIASSGEAAPNMSRSISVEMMPPPPPRPPQSLGTASPNEFKTASQVVSKPVAIVPQQQSPWPQQSLQQSSQASSCPADQQTPVYSSPPTTPQLMERKIEIVAEAAAPLPLTGGTADRSVLGKSVDSSRGTFMKNAALVKGKHAAESTDAITVNQSLPSTNWSIRRRRAESYDERRSQQNFAPSNPLSKFSGETVGNDPTVETMLANNDQQQTHTGEDESGTELSFAPKKLVLLRKRSSSCSVLTSLVSPGGCDTIDEEVQPSQHQLQLSEHRE